MVQWLKVAKVTLARSNKAAFAPASGLLAACSHRSPVLNSVKRDQRSLKSGAEIPAKLFISRRLLLGSVVLAAGAIAAWNLRKQNVDLHADGGHFQDHTGRRPLAYRGTRVLRLYIIVVIVAVAMAATRSSRIRKVDAMLLACRSAVLQPVNTDKSLQIFPKNWKEGLSKPICNHESQPCRSHQQLAQNRKAH